MARPRTISRAVVFALFCSLAFAAGGADAKRKQDEAASDERRVGVSKPVAEKLLRANERMEEEDYDAALAIVDKLAGKRNLKAPDAAQVHRFRGYILMQKGQPEQAAAELQISLDQHGLDRNAEQVTTYSLAQLYTQLGKYDAALALIERWFESAATPTADAHYLKAMILVQQENFEAALEPARTAVDLSPKPKESWLQLLAAVYIQLRDYPNVAATLERLVEISPGKKSYWVQLAAVQHFLERDSKALATLKLADTAKLIEDDKEKRQLARLLFLRELPFECAQEVEEGLAAGTVKPDAESYRLLANCYLAARETDKALGPLAKAGELSPDGDMYMLLGQLHLQRERHKEALDALQKALAKAKPVQRGSVQLLIGVAQMGAERFDDAARAFEAARNDDKVRRAAESYLEYLEERRALRKQEEPLQTASR
jgi:tetratricopeptide (TPR) repeat protein